MRFLATIHVRPRPEVRDPQGEAVRAALRSLGMDVADVRTGKEIVVQFDAPHETAAREEVARMAQELLANPVVEGYAFELQREGAPA